MVVTRNGEAAQPDTGRRFLCKSFPMDGQNVLATLKSCLHKMRQLQLGEPELHGPI